MFTGIVTAQGSVAGVAVEGDRLKLTIDAPYEDLVLGESIAVNGACLTVMERGAGNFSVEAVVTTRERTTLAALKIGSRVNLERAVAVGDRMGGHFVQGHVDGVAEVIRVTRREDAVLIDLRPPADIASVTVLHGSIAIDGVSMTVNALPEPGVIQMSVVPFTCEHTTLGSLEIGDRVHVEGDMLGKFVKQLLEARATPSTDG
ncbi:MAG: riboflavin synthase [Gemmatimonadetes bacterium]|nr:riboflavin synthase [Gemmatimonadota bacterium]